jgi:hypothetical protein
MRLFGSQFDGSFTGEVRTTDCCVRIEYDVLQHDVASCDCRCHEVFKRWG